MIKITIGVALNIAGIFIIWSRLHILHWGYGKTWVKLGQILGDDRVGQGLTALTLIGIAMMLTGIFFIFSARRQKRRPSDTSRSRILQN
jgi:LPXTG-motif cell wall-anchored protein